MSYPGRAAPSPRRAGDGGGAVGRRMLGYGLLAARIEVMGGAVGCKTRGGYRMVTCRHLLTCS
jgi:hypothetical protein